MIQNKLFRDCLAAIPAEQKAEFDLSFGIAERISPLQRPHYFTSSYTYLFSKKVILLSFLG